MSGLLIFFLLELFGLLAAGFALWKGGPAERIAAGVILVNMAIGGVSHWMGPDSQDAVRLANDGLAAVILLVITVRYLALWMGGAMLFYAAQFALHSYYIVTERAPDNLMAWVNNLNWNGVVWCLIIGTAMTWRHRSRAARRAAAAAQAAA